MSRSTWNKLWLALAGGAALACALILLLLLAAIVWNGIPAVDFDFLLTASRDFGAAGGVLYQIVGTLLLVIIAAGLCFPLALGTAIFKSEYLRSSHLQRLCALLVYGLNGVPSIIFGIFGLIFFVNMLDTGISWVVGSAVLAIMMLPTVVLATYHAIDSIPAVYRESASALGLTKWQVIVRVLLPQGIAGSFTGLLLGLARAVGETAPIMFIATAFSGVRLPGSLFEPVATLPTHILALAQQATNPQALQNAWGASFVLICIVTLFSTLALWSRSKLKLVSQR